MPQVNLDKKDMEHAYATGSRSAVPSGDAAWDNRAAAGRTGHEGRRRAAEFLFQGRTRAAVLLVTDLALLVLGNLAAVAGAPESHSSLPGGWLIWLLPPLVIALFLAWGLYRDRIAVRLVDGIGQGIAATALPAVAIIAGAALLDPSLDPAPLLARAWLFGTVYVAGGRLLHAWAQRRARAGRLIYAPTLIVGAGQIGAHVERRLTSQPQLGLLPVGYLDADPPPADMVPDRGAPVLGAPSDLGRVVEETGARHVVLGFSTAPDSMMIPLVRECEARGLQVSLVPRLFESVNVRVALDHLGGLPLFGLHSIDPKGWQFAVKHVFDRVGAGLLLFVLSPLMLGLALAVRRSSPGPVLFRQWRIGRDGHKFQILKYRSMRMDDEPAADDTQESNVVLLPTDIAPGGIEGVDRRTRIGTFMRRTSLDELPQLINVLRGDMSLVGPRPERPEFVDLFGSRLDRYDDRHRVKSGVTGWAQVSGLRGNTSMRDRVEWDNHYIENWSLSLDLKILLLTIGALFTGSRDA
jgi:exopolysaccharide biosynthesis polyprenyl glycosylphosphotransferase